MSRDKGERGGRRPSIAKRGAGGARVSNAQPGSDQREPDADSAIFRRGIFWLLGGSAVLKTLYLVDTLRVPYYADFLLLDSKQYKRVAEKIAHGDWLAGDEGFSLGPLYPYLLAVLQGFAGDGTVAIYVAQQFLGLGTLVLTALLARRCFGTLAGLAAATLLALYGPVALMELKVMASTAELFLGVASLYLFVRAREERWRIGSLAPGVLLGFTCLARPNTLLFAPVALIWLAWDGRCLGALEWRTKRGRLLPVAFAAMGIALAIAPMTWRNYSVEGDPILISSQGGIAFYQGNHPHAEATYTAPPGFTGAQETQAQESKALAEREVGRSLTTSEVSTFWLQKGLRQIRENSWSALRLALEKAAYWMGSQEYSTEYVIITERRITPSLWLMPLPFAVLLGLGIAGLWVRPRNPGAKSLMLLFIGANLASVMLFFFSSRYRMPAVPFVCAFAGAAVSALVEKIYRGERVPRCRRIAATAATGFVLSVIPWFPNYEVQAANQWYNLGNRYVHVKEYDDAERCYLRAIEVLDRKAKIHHNLGVVYKLTGRYSEATSSFERALQRDPSHVGARRQLEALIHQRVRRP